VVLATARDDSKIVITLLNKIASLNYTIYRSTTTDENSYAAVDNRVAENNSFIDSGLKQWATYYYILDACDTSSCSVSSDVASADTLPSAPNPVAASSDQIDITWDTLVGVSDYQLYVTSIDVDNTYDITSSGDKRKFTHNNLAEVTEYFYKLRLCRSPGDCSELSLASSAITYSKTPLLPIVKAISDGEISLSWFGVDNADEYRIYSATIDTGSSYEQIVSADTEPFFYEHSARKANTIYYYKLEACDGSGCESSDATGTRTFFSAPEPVGLAVVGQQQIDITWDAVDTASYTLYRARGVDRTGDYISVAADLDVNSYRDVAGLLPHTRYYYKLSLCNSSGCSGRSIAASADTLPSLPTL
jgi:hypothetical protein